MTLKEKGNVGHSFLWRGKIRKWDIYLILVEVSSNDFDLNSSIISKILEQPEDDGLLSESIAQDVEILSK